MRAKKENYIKSGIFISMQKGRTLYTASILNDQTVLSLVCGLGNAFKDWIIIFYFAYGHR